MKSLLTALLLGIFALGCASAVPKSVQDAQDAFTEVKKGDKAVEKGDLDAAIQHYEKALDLVSNAPKFRFAYAQLLYWKGLTYSQDSHHAWQKTLGREFDFETNKWMNLHSKPEGTEKEDLIKKSAAYKREGLIYFNKSMRQLQICDADWNYSVEAVPFAMGVVFIFMEEYDKAIEAFNRVLASSRVSDDYRDKIRKAIEVTKEYKKDFDASKEKEGGESLLP